MAARVVCPVQIGTASRLGGGNGPNRGRLKKSPARRQGELVARRFQDRGQRLAIVEVEDVDQKQHGQCRSNRFGSHWPLTLPHHILISLSFRFLGDLGGFGGMGGRGPPSPGVSGSTSLGRVPSLRTEIHPRFDVSLMTGPSPPGPFRVALRPSWPVPFDGSHRISRQSVISRRPRRLASRGLSST